MAKKVAYAAYIIPVRVRRGKKQIAVLKYPDGYGKIGGRFNDGEKSARVALRRELCEELGKAAAFMADTASEAKPCYKFKVAPDEVKKRGALSEERTLFVAKIPGGMELNFCEKRDENIEVAWLEPEALLDDKITPAPSQRKYLAKYIMPLIAAL